MAALISADALLITRMRTPRYNAPKFFFTSSQFDFPRLFSTYLSTLSAILWPKTDKVGMRPSKLILKHYEQKVQLSDKKPKQSFNKRPNIV